MDAQSEIERNKAIRSGKAVELWVAYFEPPAVAHAFYQAGVEGSLTSFAQYLDPTFIVTAPNYLPWGA